VQCGSKPVLSRGSTTCTAIVKGTVARPTGEVTWSVTAGAGTFSPSSCALVSGRCSVTYAQAGNPPATTHTVTASYPGDAANLPSTGSDNLVVNAPSADLGVSQTTAMSATGTTFTVHVKNQGPTDATDVVLTDTVTGTNVTRLTVSSSLSARCGTAAPPTDATASRRCVLSSLRAGSTWTVTVRVDGGLAGTTLHNSAKAKATPPDPLTADNTSSISVVRAS